MKAPTGDAPMMGMMRKMMEGAEGFNPMEMCRTMMTSVSKTSEMAFYATPEIRSLFEEWLESVEKEVFDFIRQENEVNPEKIAERFQLSVSASTFFLNHLAAMGKIQAEFAHDSEAPEKSTKSQASDD